MKPKIGKVGALALSLLFVLVVLVGGAVSLAKAASSTQQQVLSFNPPNCFLPCILGFVPGKTEFKQAVDIIHSFEQQVQILDDDDFYIASTEDGSQVLVGLRHNNDHKRDDYVDQINLSDGYGKIAKLGTLLSAGYKPLHVYRHKFSGPYPLGLLIIFGDKEQVFVEVLGKRFLSVDSPIIELETVTSTDEQWRLQELNFVLEGDRFDCEVARLGFASVEKYLNANCR